MRYSSFFWNSFLVSFFYAHLWEFIFLSLYENKLVYESHDLKQIFYHQNKIMIFCWFRMFQCYAFYFEFLSLNSLNAVAIFTLFALLDCLPSFESIEFIFYFNPTNLPTGIPLYWSFILPTITSFWSSQNLESFEKLLKSNKRLYLKKSSQTSSDYIW